jgi:winged helix-turn-helix protein
VDGTGGAGADQSKFGKALGLSTVQFYLKRWGFTAQKPLCRAMQRDP